MNTNPVTPAPITPNFKAVRFEPQNLKEWNQEVLAAILESKFVRTLIKDNEATPQVDTILQYSRSTHYPRFKEPYEAMDFSVYSGNSLLTHINSSYDAFANHQDIIRNLSKKMVEKIQEADRRFEIDNRIQQGLDDIKKLAAEVIYSK